MKIESGIKAARPRNALHMSGNHRKIKATIGRKLKNIFFSLQNPSNSHGNKCQQFFISYISVLLSTKTLKWRLVLSVYENGYLSRFPSVRQYDTFQKQGAVVVGKIKQGTRYNLDHGALRCRQAPFARRTASTACPK